MSYNNILQFRSYYATVSLMNSAEIMENITLSNTINHLTLRLGFCPHDGIKVNIFCHYLQGYYSFATHRHQRLNFHGIKPRWCLLKLSTWNTIACLLCAWHYEANKWQMWPLYRASDGVKQSYRIQLCEDLMHLATSTSIQYAEANHTEGRREAEIAVEGLMVPQRRVC